MRAFVVQRLGHDGEPGLAARERKELETALAHALERVRRATGLEGAAAQRRRAHRSHLAGGGEYLLLRLHRAGTSDDLHGVAAEHHAGRDAHEGVVLLPLARDLLVRLADVDDLGHARQRFDARAVHAAIIADETYRRALSARHRPRLIA